MIVYKQWVAYRRARDETGLAVGWFLIKRRGWFLLGFVPLYMADVEVIEVP